MLIWYNDDLKQGDKQEERSICFFYSLLFFVKYNRAEPQRIKIRILSKETFVLAQTEAVKRYTNMFWKRKPKFETPQITDTNFNEVVGGAKVPVLLDFYANWCGPCKVIGPIIDELAEEFDGRALVAKVNTEVNPGLSQHFSIKSIPTLVIIHQGKLVERFQGLIPKPNLEEILEEYIALGGEEPISETE